MIYDCFTFFNENDLLELKVNIEKDYVDKFVVIEAPITFAGVRKGLNFDKARFEQYKDKIIYCAIENFPKFDSPWLNENFQRNYILKVLQQNGCKDDDIIMITDIDEIVSENVIKNYQKGIMSIEQNNYYYYFNYLQLRTKWYGPKILRFSDFFTKQENVLVINLHKEIAPDYSIEYYTPNEIRCSENCEAIKCGGWHFSFLGGEEAIINKIKAYSHQEYNNDKFLDIEHIQSCIAKGKDIFGRKGFNFCPIPFDNSFPKYILNNQEAFQKNIFKISSEKKLYYFFKQKRSIILNFLYSKKRNGLERNVRICGINFKYKKQYSH